MTIALRGTVQSATAFPVNHSAITGLAANDLILDIASNHNGGTAPVFDTTYTFTTIATGAYASTRNYHYGRRIATGAETGIVTTSGASLAGVLYFALQAIDTTTPIESYVSQENTFGTSCPFPASTPTTDNCWHIVLAQNTSSTDTISTGPTGYTALGSAISAQGAAYAWYKDLGAGSSGVATSASTVTWTGSISGFSAGFIVRPSASVTSDPAASTSRFTTSRHTFGTRR